MSAQPVVETHLPYGRGLTWEDLQSVPDEDHWRYEIVDGSLLVSPAPDLVHQRCVFKLAQLLDAARPDHLEVLTAPFDYTPVTGLVLQPDVLVLDPDRADRRRTYVAPLLVVEVLSPGSLSRDRVLKRALYAQHGVPAYWIVDPVEPSLMVLELCDGDYRVVAEQSGTDAAVLTSPFAVEVVPARLIDRSR